MTPTTSQEVLSFDGLGIAPQLLDILKANRFVTPSPIQHQSIPVAIEGKDIIGIAQTGTGKTLAFGIPTIQRLAKFKGKGLILLPTRELALQVEESLRRIGGGLGMRTAVLIGGASMHMQIQAIKKNPHVIIATPGRLIDHLEQKTISLKDVKILVLDEADRMLDMGFAPQINRILETVPTDRQTMLFSATMPTEIVKIANNHMKLPVRVEIARAGTASERVAQELFFIEKSNKDRLLEKLLGEYKGTVLVFSRTKHGAKKIARNIRAMGHTADELHANRSLAQRKAALEGFKNGKYRILVATDIAARGIDVKGIELVINYDLPDNSEDYVHRIGRTGRAGREGRAISFATPDQKRDVKDIERLMRVALPVTKVPTDLPAARKVAASDATEITHQRGGRSHGGNRPMGRPHGERRYDKNGVGTGGQPQRDMRGPSARPARRNDRRDKRDSNAPSVNVDFTMPSAQGYWRAPSKNTMKRYKR